MISHARVVAKNTVNLVAHTKKKASLLPQEEKDIAEGNNTKTNHKHKTNHKQTQLNNLDLVKSAQSLATSTSNLARWAKAVQNSENGSQQKLAEAANEISESINQILALVVMTVDIEV